MSGRSQSAIAGWAYETISYVNTALCGDRYSVNAFGCADHSGRNANVGGYGSPDSFSDTERDSDSTSSAASQTTYKRLAHRGDCRRRHRVSYFREKPV
jgi:hypothetical protein